MPRCSIIGAGGLGSPVALYLAAAGVGHIGIVDADVVDLSNLQRQVIHQTKDLNTPKVESAKEKMIAINPDVEVTTYHTFLASDNAEEIIKPWDFIIDCTDNFPVKFLINDACVRLGKAFSHGGILRFQGQTFTHLPGTACYRCFFKEPPPAGTVPTSSQAGVLGAIAGMLGTIQAAEALKYSPRCGRTAHRPIAHLRCQDDELPHHQAKEACILRNLRRPPDFPPYAFCINLIY